MNNLNVLCSQNLRINNHRHFRTIKKPDAPVSLHTESHYTNFDVSLLLAIIHILAPRISSLTRRLWEGAIILANTCKYQSNICNTEYHFLNPFPMSTCARADRRLLSLMWASAMLFFYHVKLLQRRSGGVRGIFYKHESGRKEYL